MHYYYSFLYSTTLLKRMNQGKRLDLTAELFAKHSLDWIVSEVSQCTTVHLSGRHLHLTLKDVEWLLRSLVECTELFVFKGGAQSIVTEHLLAKYLPSQLTILMLWEFDCSRCAQLAAALRHHPRLQRITINLPTTIQEHAALDVLAMGLAATPNLQVLQIRVSHASSEKNSSNHGGCSDGSSHRRSHKQQDCIISPEAFAILLRSTTIHSLYLENCGLLDDHMDVLVDELTQGPSANNDPTTKKALQTLDLSHNWALTEDALFSAGRLLASEHCPLVNLDLSGVEITEQGGQAVADALHRCRTTRLQYLELEGTRFFYHDEFSVPTGHTQTPWMQQIHYQLRLNRATAHRPNLAHDRAQFVEALTSVSDQVPCAYQLLRQYPHHGNHLRKLAKYVAPTTPTEGVKSVYDVFAALQSPYSVALAGAELHFNSPSQV